MAGETTGRVNNQTDDLEAVNRVDSLLADSQIKRIFVNGRTAEKLYRQYLFPMTGMEAVLLPSTSPANAAFSKERLVEAWSVIAKEL